MHKVTFRQLQIFASVANHRNFTRAAEELFLTQSSVSAQLKKLAETVGVQLIEQVGKKVFITPAGERVLALYGDVEGSWTRFENEMTQLKDPHAGELSLSGVNTSQYFVPRVLGAFSRRYPNIKISFKVINRKQVEERMLSNMDDLYIIGRPPADQEIKAIPFVDNPLVVVATPEHPLAGSRGIDPALLEAEAFITRELGSGTRKEVQQYFDSLGLNLNTVIELGGNEAIKQGIIGGLGISILSRLAVITELQTGQLVALDVKGFPLQREWLLAYPEDHHISAVARTFIDYVKSDGRVIAAAMPRLKQTETGPC